MFIRYIICSDSSRCKKFNLIEVDNMFICKNCNAIFNKPFKIVIVKNLLVCKYFLTNNQPYLTARIFFIIYRL